MVEVDVLIEAEGWSALAEAEALVTRAVEAALTAANEGQSAPLMLSVLLADDAAISTLNATWRAKDKPTNVLSFPAPAMPGGGPRFLGDIALAYETCAREAGDEGKRLEDHVTHLVIHGVLHLLGHDHETEAEAERMEALETRILAGLGIADPYAEPPETRS